MAKEKKYKLPRKRKKAYIKARGRQNYMLMTKWCLPANKTHVFPKEVKVNTISLGQEASSFEKVGRW